MNEHEEGEFTTRINAYMLIECDRCPMEFHDLAKFEEHWEMEHSVNYGSHSYKKIIIGQIPQKEVIKMVAEAQHDFPKNILFLLKVAYKQMGYKFSKEDVVELYEWFQKWFGAVEHNK